MSNRVESGFIGHPSFGLKFQNAKSFVFDDFMIHEAWNFTCQNRLVLIIDFLKDENKLPDSIKFVDKNFNNSVKTYFRDNEED